MKSSAYITFVPLLLMIASDWRIRKVPVYLMILFTGSVVFHVIYTIPAGFIIASTVSNLILLAVMFSVSFLWLSLKYPERSSKAFIGYGDIIFFVVLVPVFAPDDFLQFLLFSFIASLIWWNITACITRENKTVPLISVAGVCYILFMLCHE